MVMGFGRLLQPYDLQEIVSIDTDPSDLHLLLRGLLERKLPQRKETALCERMAREAVKFFQSFLLKSSEDTEGGTE
jgi:hypothetical protein